MVKRACVTRLELGEQETVALHHLLMNVSDTELEAKGLTPAQIQLLKDILDALPDWMGMSEEG